MPTGACGINCDDSTIRHLVIMYLLTRKQQHDNIIFDMISKCCDILTF